MAALDFPASPVNGQIYDPGTGTLYKWNGLQWDVITGVTGHAETRNRLFNPAMQVSQENGSGAVSTSSSYPADQWAMLFSGGIAGQAARGDAVALSPDGNNFAYLQSVGTLVASPAAGAFIQNIQFIEGQEVADFLWGTANAKPVVLRFNARCDIPGLYPVCIMNAANNRSYIKGVNLTATWQTFEIPIPGETTGVWPKDSTHGMSVRFPTMCGTTYLGVEGWQNNASFGLPGMANLGSQINKNFIVTDVGLYLDPDSTGKAPPFEIPDPAAELIRCRRYYAKYVANFMGGFTATAASQVLYGAFQFQTQMRVNATMSAPSPVLANAAAPSFVGGTDGARIDVASSAAGVFYAFLSTLIANSRM